MSKKEIHLQEAWLPFERLAELLQDSVQTADRRLAQKSVGDVRYVIADLSISATVELGIDDSTERPVVRLPQMKELADKGTDLARVTFSLRPVPLDAEERTAAIEAAAVEGLVARLDEKKYTERLAAIREIVALGKPAIFTAAATLRQMAKNDRSAQVREAAQKALSTITVSPQRS